MHLELGGVNQESWADELFVELVVAQNVADILAQKALDAFPKFLNPVGIGLRHPPSAVGRIGRSGRELPDSLLRPEVGRDIGHQIFHRWKGPHWLDGDRLLEIQLAQSRHA
jgi:hypothetical protein